ncbi:MAG TPA: hypothetical protein VH165_04175 [Kofleriaceae bacterium]|nr:hypothetical protein [Kofleriaceae bacterium]
MGNSGDAGPAAGRAATFTTDDDEAKPTTLPEALDERIGATWEAVRAVEPARGAVEPAQLAAVHIALDELTAERARHDLSALPAEARDKIDGSMAAIYARGAVVATAASDDAAAARWLTTAAELARDDEQRAQLIAAQNAPERYRALSHGRILFARGHESAARKLWKTVARGDADAMARTATAELEAPRPIKPGTKMPTLYRLNGFGAAFYGRRDVRRDGSYVTTHCISLAFVPVMPLSAWRVRDIHRGYNIMARERLSRFARIVRWALPAAIALAVAIAGVVAYLDDPVRLARRRWDRTLEAAHTGTAEPALRRLDDELANDLRYVDQGRAERAGAEIVRLSASYVAAPFTADQLAPALRVVHRYQALPSTARGGVAQAEMIATLERWAEQAGRARDASEARTALLAAEYQIADPGSRAALGQKITAARLALAGAKQADWPLEALAILVEPVAGADTAPLSAQADKIIERLCDAPSLLVDAGADFDAWLASGSPGLLSQASHVRDFALADKAAVEAEHVTPAQLADLQARRPKDQYAALALALGEASAGKLADAVARLTRIGPPGWMIRDARLALARLLAEQGKLDDADALLDSLLGAELVRFASAAAEAEQADHRVQDRIKQALDTGRVPADLRARVEATHDDAQRDELIRRWVSDQIEHDDELSSARAKLTARGRVVPAALAAGAIKLRRAQAMAEPARSRMLADAERTYLAIRIAAEGQPSYELGLGEIYARLGKTAESDAALAKVLAKNDPELSLGVASVYRRLGSVARAKQIARQVFDTGNGPSRDSAAQLLGVMSVDDEDEAEGWLRKVSHAGPAIRAALLEVEARRLLHRGDLVGCAAKFVAAAKLQMDMARTDDATGYNNAAVADQAAFGCSSDPQLMRDAAAAVEAAYRRDPDEPIVASNVLALQTAAGDLRVAAKRVDTKALRLDETDAARLINTLLDSPERAGLIAEISSDPSLRRAREVLAQYEILAPNNPASYTARLRDASRMRDVDAVAAAVERARHAKALDASELQAERARWSTGAEDARWFATFDSQRVRLETALARKDLDPKTRAAGNFLLAGMLERYAVFQSDTALLVRAHEAALQAQQLWPALDTHELLTRILIDQAGLAANPKVWIAARRHRDPAGALDQLAADHAPLAAAIQGAAQWLEIVSHAKANARRPDVDTLRLARLIGDPALEARARAVLDDKLAHLSLELSTLIDPSNVEDKVDLAYLDRR